MMDIGLITLQRESDILEFKYDDITTSRWNFVTIKTGDALSVVISTKLQEVVDRSRADNSLSRFVVHKRHSRSRRGPDFVKVNINSFNVWFKDMRVEAGIYDHLLSLQWPSFHDIRAVGTKLYRDAGIDPQPLLRHKNKAMTDHYDSGHSEIRYTQINQVLVL